MHTVTVHSAPAIPGRKPRLSGNPQCRQSRRPGQCVPVVRRRRGRTAAISRPHIGGRLIIMAGFFPRKLYAHAPASRTTTSRWQRVSLFFLVSISVVPVTRGRSAACRACSLLQVADIIILLLLSVRRSFNPPSRVPHRESRSTGEFLLALGRQCLTS